MERPVRVAPRPRMGYNRPRTQPGAATRADNAREAFVYPTIEVFGRTIGTYGLCAAVGLLAVLLCVGLLARRMGRDPDETVVMALVSFVGVAVGAVLLYGLTNAPLVVQVVQAFAAGAYPSFGAFARDLVACFSGFVFYGGLAGGLAAGCLYSRRRGWDLPGTLDLFAVAVPLFHVFGRIGCFMGGCCYGVEADWGVVYHNNPVAEVNGVPRVPIQLIESACNLVIFCVVLTLFLKGRMQGRLIAVYGLLYATVRFVDEFWRGDVYRGIWGPFSTSQWISLLVIVAAVAYLLAMRRRRRGDVVAASGPGV